MHSLLIYCVCSYIIVFFSLIIIFALQPDWEVEDFLAPTIFAPLTLTVVILALCVFGPIMIAVSIGRYINLLNKTWKKNN